MSSPLKKFFVSFGGRLLQHLLDEFALEGPGNDTRLNLVHDRVLAGIGEEADDGCIVPGPAALNKELVVAVQLVEVLGIAGRKARRRNGELAGCRCANVFDHLHTRQPPIAPIGEDWRRERTSGQGENPRKRVWLLTEK